MADDFVESQVNITGKIDPSLTNALASVTKQVTAVNTSIAATVKNIGQSTQVASQFMMQAAAEYEKAGILHVKAADLMTEARKFQAAAQNTAPVRPVSGIWTGPPPQPAAAPTAATVVSQPPLKGVVKPTQASSVQSASPVAAVAPDASTTTAGAGQGHSIAGLAEAATTAGKAVKSSITEGVVEPMSHAAFAADELASRVEHDVRDKIVESFSKARESVSKFMEGIAGIGLPSLGVAGLAAFAGEAVKTAGIIETGAIRIKQAFNLSEEDYKPLEKVFDELAQKAVAPVPVSQAAYLKLRGTIKSTAEEANEMFKQIMVNQKLTGASFEDVQDIATTAVNGLKVPLGEVGKLMSSVKPELVGKPDEFSKFFTDQAEGLQNLGMANKQNAPAIVASYKVMGEVFQGAPKAMQDSLAGVNSILTSGKNPYTIFGHMTKDAADQTKAEGGTYLDTVHKVMAGLQEQVNKAGGIDTPNGMLQLSRITENMISPEAYRALVKYDAAFIHLNDTLAKVRDQVDTTEKDVKQITDSMDGMGARIGAAMEKLDDYIGKSVPLQAAEKALAEGLEKINEVDESKTKPRDPPLIGALDFRSDAEKEAYARQHPEASPPAPTTQLHSALDQIMSGRGPIAKIKPTELPEISVEDKRKPPQGAEGGTVDESGLAVIHKGEEIVSGVIVEDAKQVKGRRDFSNLQQDAIKPVGSDNFWIDLIMGASEAGVLRAIGSARSMARDTNSSKQDPSWEQWNDTRDAAKNVSRISGHDSQRTEEENTKSTNRNTEELSRLVDLLKTNNAIGMIKIAEGAPKGSELAKYVPGLLPGIDLSQPFRGRPMFPHRTPQAAGGDAGAAAPGETPAHELPEMTVHGGEGGGVQAAPSVPPNLSSSLHRTPYEQAGGSEASTSLQGARTKFADELKDPAIRDRLSALTEKEVGSQGPQAQQAFVETVLNRAAARKQSLDQTMRPGYYPNVGNVGALTQTQRDHYDTIAKSVMGGSNISNFATGNASGNVGFGGGSQTASLGGERYGIEKQDEGWAGQMKGAGQESVGSGSGDYAGTGGFNFMGSARARAMGIDVEHGAASMVSRDTAAGKIRANKYAADDIAGFIDDLHKSGAPLKDFSGVFADRQKRGGSSWSQHAYGNAIDIETGFGHGPDNSAALYAWAKQHPEEFQKIQDQHHMKNLERTDWGHFEWSPAERAAAGKKLDAKKALVASAPSGGDTSATPGATPPHELPQMNVHGGEGEDDDKESAARKHFEDKAKRGMGSFDEAPQTDAASPESDHARMHQSMLESHRNMRAEMEKPIRMSVEAPDTPRQVAGLRSRAGRQQQRWTGEDMAGNQRYSTNADIGIS